MKIGIITVSVDVAALAKRAEELGFDSFWIPEHTATPVHIAPKTTTYRLHLEPDGTPQPLYRSGKFADPFITLARASAMTQTIKLGTGVCLVPEHHPLLLAKQVATLDNFSGGRFLFGIGAGWLNEETEIMGGDFAHRWGQTREAILAMKGLWSQEAAEFHGKYYDFPSVIAFPKPVQQPHPPIYIGAFGMGNVFRRVVTYGNAWMPWMFTPEQIRQGRAILNDLARDAGRDPHSIEVVAMPVPANPDVFKAYEDAGADGVVVLVMPAPEKEMVRELEQIAQKVLT
ncbi:MAG TPA: LLM class F420-dependent oxidoreductase [Candidatus Tectomicrobia bacterium]|nr:LLM class F420-dependent oxidoreductase [Candidatus Tectomicrobia bacterium]